MEPKALDRDLILVKMLKVLANCEMAAARLLAPLMNLPEISFRDSTELSRIIWDESCHGNECIKLLRTLPAQEAAEAAKAVENLQVPNNLIRAFNHPLKTLVDAAVFTAIMDLSADFLIGNFMDPMLLPLKTFLLKDEGRHIGFGWSRIPEYWLNNPEEVESLLEVWIARALENFGRNDSEFDRLKLQYGLTRHPAVRIKRGFAASVWGRIAKASIQASELAGKPVEIKYPKILDQYTQEFRAITRKTAAAEA